MTWYYADAGKQAGPVDDAQFEALVNAGNLTPDTLVWHEGMANWQPLREVRPTAAAAPPAAGAPATAVGAAPPVAGGAVDEVVCAECGKIFAKSNAIQYGSTWVCASCKPVFIQKIREGVAVGARRGRRQLPVDPDQLVAEISARGVEVNIGDCVSRAWNLVKDNLGLTIGTTVLVTFCMQAPGICPYIGACIGLILNGPFMGGLYSFYLKLIRGEFATVGDGFAGFRRFWPLVGTFVLMCLILYAGFIPGGIYLAASGELERNAPSAFGLIICALGLIPLLYFAVTLFYAIPLVMDLELGPVNALKVSLKVTSKRFFSFLGLGLVCGLIMFAGVLALCVGIIFAMPIAYATWMYAYEDVFGQTVEYTTS